MTQAVTPKTTGEMMADIMGNVASLMRNEVDLARTEVTSSLAKAAGALGLMAFAFLLAITGLNILAASLVALVIWAGVPPLYAASVVGVALLIISYTTFLSAKSALGQIGFVPIRAARSVQQDATAIKEAYNDN